MSRLSQSVRPAVLILATLVVVAYLGSLFYQASRVRKLTIAAGARTGESFILCDALRKVVERNYSWIKITVRETEGTAENLRWLEDGRAQLATAQADMQPGPSARNVAVLYDDVLQLLTARNSPVHSFPELRGRTLALPRNGGQYQSFLTVAEHYGLGPNDFGYSGDSQDAADAAFRSGAAEAMFRVRTLGDPVVQDLVKSGSFRLLAIEHGAAMRIRQPEFSPAMIPKGAYRGDPPVPDRDLETVAVHRRLLASASAGEDDIRAITEVLIERRTELMQEIPADLTEVRLLLAQVRRPDPGIGLEPALHPGARGYYDKDKPSFVQAHADFVGLLLTVGLMLASWVWQVSRWMKKRYKSNADRYSNRAVDLMISAQAAESVSALDDIWRELLSLLTAAVHDLDADSLSETSFESFRSILRIALDVARERRALLTSTAAM